MSQLNVPPQRVGTATRPPAAPAPPAGTPAGPGGLNDSTTMEFDRAASPDAYLELAIQICPTHPQFADLVIEEMLRRMPGSPVASLAHGVYLLRRLELDPGADVGVRAETTIERAAAAATALEEAVRQATEVRDPALLSAARFSLGTAYQRLGRPDDALAQLRLAHEDGRGNVHSRVTFADSLGAYGRWAEAVEVYDSALQLGPAHPDALLGKARALRECNRHDEALAIYDQAERALPPADCAAVGAPGAAATAAAARADLLAGRADALRHLRRLGDAQAAAEAAMDLAPDDPTLVLTWGQVLLRQGRGMSAVERLDELVARNPDHVPTLIARGQAWRAIGGCEQAFADFDRATQLAPCDPRAWAYRGDAWLDRDQFDQALADLNRATELAPREPWTWVRRGDAYQSRQWLAESLRDYDQALRLNDQFTWAVSHRAESLRLMGRHAEAWQGFERHLALRPHDPWSLSHRGASRRSAGDYGAALRDLNDALVGEPTESWILGQRGHVWLDRGELDRAVEDLTRALDEFGRNDWAAYCRAVCHRVAGRDDRAAADFHLAVEVAQARRVKRPRLFRNLFNLALYYLAAGETPKAEGLYQDGINAAPPPYAALEALDDLRELRRYVPPLCGMIAKLEDGLARAADARAVPG